MPANAPAIAPQAGPEQNLDTQGHNYMSRLIKKFKIINT
jgi:hypothetical protein